jgi:arylsulfatase A-like enzyme
MNFPVKQFALGCIAWVSIAWATSGEIHAAGAPRPNIVVILSDDMGYSDLGCYGGEIQTPNLDRLAAGGLRFTQFYNTGRCCPTRASLLTGLYPHQAGMGHMINDRGHDGYRGDLNRRCVTIPEVLRPAGYGTYAVGKWHITKGVVPDGPKQNWPLQRGFDRFYGTIAGGGDYFDPGTLTRDNAMISAMTDSEYRPKRYYYTDAISHHAAKFIADHRQRHAGTDRPFFLYVAYTAAHWPMHALEEDIAKYRGKYDQGYEPVRKARLERMRRMNLIDRDWKPASTTGDWSKVKDKVWESRCMEVYAAMVDRMDQGIGRIVAELENQKILDNTLILYMQDNGGCAEIVGRQGNEKKAQEPKLPKIAADAVRLEVRPKQTRAGWPMLMGRGVMPGPAETYIAYGEGWANVSNTPFREYKHFVHEGGIATPLVAHWLAGIKRGGGLTHEPGHLIDVMATCVELAGAKYPNNFNGQKIQPPAGKSLVPAFEGRPIEREAIYWEHEGNRAVRAGDWKLVAKENKPWELYELASDRTEQRDVIREQPDQARRLITMWETWAKRSHVLPLGTWRDKKESEPKKAVAKPVAATEKNAANRDRKPNIVLIVADDLGYGDIGCHGGKQIPTPNIDSLAAHGVRCTSGYVTCPVCSPTRAGLLTGRYQQRFGHEFNPGPPAAAPVNFGLPLSEKTLADRLKMLGYATGMVGKWHLGFKPEYRPPSRGFDEFFGFLGGAHSYTNARADGTNPILRGRETIDEKEYLTDALTREATAFISRHKQEPFFLYLTYNAVHAPLQAPQKYLARFAGIENERRRTYAAMLSAMDDGIGRVLETLRRDGLEQNTLVFFISDNGGPPGNASNNAPLSGRKGGVLEGGIRVPFLLQWRGKLPEGKIYDAPVVSLDILSTAIAAAGGQIEAGARLDGVNLLPHLTGEKTDPPHDALFWRFGEARAARSGNWKLVRQRASPPRLFDLSADIGETKDLAAEKPDIARDLQARLTKWDSQLAEPLWKGKGTAKAAKKARPKAKLKS